MAQDILSRLKVIIGADPKQFVSGIQQGQRALTGFQKSVNLFAKAATGIFAAGIISKGISDIVNLADVQAKAEAKLLTALKGRSDIQESLIKQSKDLQKTTLFGDEETINAQALLAAMGLTETAVKRLTPLVQDLAVKQGTDLRSAADLVAKSVGSSTNALSRYGITIEGAVGSAERLESAVTNLNKVVGGQAEAAAKAGAGSITQFKNQLGDLGEDLGTAIIPALSKLFEFFSAGVTNLQTAVDFVKDPLAVFRSELEQTAAVIENISNRGTPLSDLFGGVGKLELKDPTFALSGLFTNIAAIRAGAEESALGRSVGIVSDLKLLETQGEGVRQKFTEIISEINRLKSTSLGGGRFGDSFGLFSTSDTSNIDSENALARLSKSFEGQGTGQEAIKGLNVALQDTINITGVLQSSFNGLFQSILSGGASAEDIFKGLVSTLAGGLLNVATGGIFGSIFGGATSIATSVSGGQISQVISTGDTRRRASLGGI